MNWTHWNIDCLAPLLLMSPTYVDTLLTSQLKSWQLDGLNFFGYGNNPRIQISNGLGFTKLSFDSLKFIWNFDQIDRFSFFRSQVQFKSYQSGDHQVHNFIAPTIADISSLRVKRILNSVQLQDFLLDNNANLIQPSSLSYSEKLSTYGHAQTILTLPGSDSINALLFGCRAKKIIQMIPWPNDLMFLNKYSMIVAFRQLAFQTSLNVLPFFGSPPSSAVSDFDGLFTYSTSDLMRLL